MFIDTKNGDPWGEPAGPSCRSCKQPIGPNERWEDVRFPEVRDQALHDLNGPYHEICARPFLSMKRALEMMQRPLF